MLNSRKRWRVRLVWERRALAFCRCWYTIFSAVCSNRRAARLRPSHHDCTKAAAAVRSWQTVRSGFFPPPLLPDAGEEQMANSGHRLVPQQPQVVAALVVIEAQFGFLILK